MCANIDFPFPGTLVNGALARAAGTDPDTDPWLPQRAVWPLLEVVEAHFDDPWLAPLAQHIRNSETVHESKRFSSIRHVADLFDRYAVHRPDMLQRWAEGSADEDEAAWQVELWRLLRTRIGQPSPAERLVDACRRLRDEPGLSDLPPRLSLFGLTRLPASYLDVLEAMGAGRDVHLFLLHPSPALWDRLETEVGPTSRFLLRAQDPTVGAPRHPLLQSWGRDAREMQLVLGVGRAPRRGSDRGAARRRRRPSCGRSRTTSGPTAHRREAAAARLTGGRCSPAMTTASVSIPATAGAGRSRCCATQSCTCWRTMRPWSRATSSSCAPTSRPSPR